jgi:hypothetical protein
MTQTDKDGKTPVIDPATGQPRVLSTKPEMDGEMLKQRLIAISQTGASSIAGMKAGVLHETAAMLSNPAVRGQIEDSTLQGIYDRMEDIARNANTLNSSEAPDAIVKMRDDLKTVVPTPRP